MKIEKKKTWITGIAAMFSMLGVSGTNSAMGAESMAKMPAKMQTATFAAGCFWHVEDTFQHIKGVKSAVSGYTGGNVANPSYEQVCSGATHHAEAVEVTYDPSKVSYGELLNVFWQSHDPTTLNSQGPDHGEQYRSAIFYHTPEQKTAALASEQKLIASGKVKGAITTQILPASPFYKAEEYHQNYYAKHGGGFCGIHFN